MPDVRLTYENGTIRVESDGDLSHRDDIAHTEFDPRSKTRRAPGYRYADLVASLDDHDIEYEDRVLNLPTIGSLASTYELREYQAAALDVWYEHDRRGVLQMPTGSGKTVVAIKAIEKLGIPTLVVVPTVDLLVQWREELETEFDVEVGQLGGGTQELGPVTVSTYDSAYLRADDIGDRFGLVVFDEVHHLGGEGFREIARFMTAPARMGLTATFERPDDAHEVISDLVGPKVYEISPEELAGDHLASYDIKRLSVELTPDEREAYERHQAVFVDYLKRSNITLRSGNDYQKLVMRSGNDPKAREALLAKQRARAVMMGSDAKVDALADLLARHRDDRVIVFTAHNELVYRLSERFLIPAITHRTRTAERREILRKFREGTYSRVVTSNVLDEGVDVPDANVAVVLSGSGSEREFTQRLGRILRPKADGGRAVLYEVVSKETAEIGIASRRR